MRRLAVLLVVLGACGDEPCGTELGAACAVSPDAPAPAECAIPLRPDGTCGAVPLPNVSAANDDVICGTLAGGYPCYDTTTCVDRGTFAKRFAVSAEGIVSDGASYVGEDDVRMPGYCVPGVFTCTGDCSDRTTVTDQGWFVGAVDGIVYLRIATDLATCPLVNCSAPTTIASGFGGDHTVIDASGIYWKASDGLYALPVGGSPTRIVSDPGALRALALDAARIYWTTDDGVFACPKTAASCTPVRLAPAVQPVELYVDSTDLYWLESGELVSCAKTGCAAPARLYQCSSQVLPTTRALRGDSENIYCAIDPVGVFGVVQLPKAMLGAQAR